MDACKFTRLKKTYQKPHTDTIHVQKETVDDDHFSIYVCRNSYFLLKERTIKKFLCLSSCVIEIEMKYGNDL